MAIMYLDRLCRWGIEYEAESAQVRITMPAEYVSDFNEIYPDLDVSKFQNFDGPAALEVQRLYSRHKLEEMALGNRLYPNRLEMSLDFNRSEKSIEFVIGEPGFDSVFCVNTLRNIFDCQGKTLEGLALEIAEDVFRELVHIFHNGTSMIGPYKDLFFEQMGVRQTRLAAPVEELMQSQSAWEKAQKENWDKFLELSEAAKKEEQDNLSRDVRENKAFLALASFALHRYGQVITPKEISNEN